MITVCYPYDEMELSFLICILNREGIPHLIIGQHFGSIFPGLQIASYNERTIQVPKSFEEKAIKAIEEFRKIDVRLKQAFTSQSKVRMIFEALIFGWFIPGGAKKPSNKSFKPTPKSGAV